LLSIANCVSCCCSCCCLLISTVWGITHPVHSTSRLPQTQRQRQKYLTNILHVISYCKSFLIIAFYVYIIIYWKKK
jgi:hypothetical protein